MNGVELIQAERQRQLDVEGWTQQHDDAHTDFDLSSAARSYAWAAEANVRFEAKGRELAVPNSWPWERSWWKPSDDPIRNLVKAGALIAAEIDRLQRMKSEQP